MSTLREVKKTYMADCYDALDAAVELFGEDIRIHNDECVYWVDDKEFAIITELYYGRYRIEVCDWD